MFVFETTFGANNQIIFNRCNLIVIKNSFISYMLCERAIAERIPVVSYDYAKSKSNQ